MRESYSTEFATVPGLRRITGRALKDSSPGVPNVFMLYFTFLTNDAAVFIITNAALGNAAEAMART